MTRTEPSAPRPNIEEVRKVVSAALRRHWVVFFVEGIVLVALGLFAAAAPAIASLAATFLLGWLLSIGGGVGFFLTLWARDAPGFWWSILSSVLAVVTGALLIRWPVGGVLSLTLVLAGFFILDGIASIMIAADHRKHFSRTWGWLLASGVIDLVLAALILSGFPQTASWAIGLILGFDLIFGGAALVVMALAAREEGL